ncbi:subtilisin-like protease SBT2.4 [Tanacetum coccineum]
MNSQVHLENVRSGKEKVGTSFLHSGYGSLVADVGIPGYGLGSSSVCDGSYSSHGVGFADIVLFVGKRSPRKEKAVVLDFQNSAVSLPSGKHTTSLSSFHSGFGKGQMVLDFENSAVRLSSAKEDMFNDGEDRDIYLVLVEGDQPVAFFQDSSVSYKSNKKLDTNSEILKAHAKHLEESHDQLLQSTLEQGSYNKLYSFNHIVNGFSVHTTPSQAKKLKNTPGVKLIEKDNGVKLMTTYTPKFLELPTGVWPTVGGRRHAGEGIVIGFVDSGINPSHPSFAYRPRRGYPKNLTEFNGVCDEGPMFPKSSCNGKIVTARYFSAGVKASGLLNASVDICWDLYT